MVSGLNNNMLHVYKGSGQVDYENLAVENIYIYTVQSLVISFS